MTPALADLTAYLLVCAHPESASPEQREAVQQEARELYDGIAHELAEKIRAESARMAAFRSQDMQARAATGRRMADLIDADDLRKSTCGGTQHPAP